MSDTPKGLLESAKAAYRRMNRQIRAGNLAEAVKLFKAMPAEFDSTQELAFNRPIAAVHLIFGCLDAGNLAEAHRLLEAMAELGDAREVALLRTEAAHNLMIGYIHAGNLPAAHTLLETMAELPETASLRDEAIHNLIIGYLYAGDFSEAQKLFESMAMPNPRRKPKERWGEYSRSFISSIQKYRSFE